MYGGTKQRNCRGVSHTPLRNGVIMKRIVLILLLLLLLLLLCLGAVLPLKAQGLQPNTAFVVKENSGQMFSFENVVDDFSIDTSMGYFKVNVSNEYSVLHSVGNPSLPVVQKILTLPVGSTVEVEIVADKVEEYSLPLMQKMYPVQPSQPKSSEPAPWQFNHEVYTTDDYYCNPLVDVSLMGTMRGVQLVRLTISPFEYNPVRNALKVHTSVSAQVKTVFETTDNRQRATIGLAKTHCSQLISKAYANELQWGSDVPLKYVVVARDSFREALQPFVSWKTQMGYNVVQYYPPADANRDTIRKELARMYNDATPLDPAPTFLLIVGDVEQIQSFIGRYTLPQGVTHATDLYYAEYTGDIYPDVLYGRWSATTVEQLQTIVGKTIEYEQYIQADTSNLSRALLVAGRENREPAPTLTNGQINYLKTTLANHFGMDTACYYNPTSYNQKEDILSKLSTNPGFINYSAHCTATGWNSPTITKADVDTFSTHGGYSFVINNCCKSNNYTIGVCFGESLLRKAGAGAVGVIGAANETLWDEDYYWSIGAKAFTVNPTYDAAALGAFDRMFHSRQENVTDYVFTQGQMLQAGGMSVALSGSPYENYYWEIYNLLGDPSLMPYIGSPQPVTLLVGDTIRMGDVAVSCSGTPLARVAIMQDSLLLGTTMLDENGNGTLRLVRPIISTNVILTATAQYHHPIIDTITVLPSTAAKVVIVDYSFRDTLGNVITTVQPNQIVGFYGRLQNVGSATAYSIAFKMGNATGVDTVMQNLAFDSLASDSVYEGLLSSFVVAESVRDNDVLSFDAVLFGNDVMFQNNIGIMVSASAVEQLAVMFTDEESNTLTTVLQEGGTYKVEVPIVNSGSCVSDSVQVSLAVNDVAVLQSDVVSMLPPLSVGDTATAMFIIKLNSIPDSSLMLRVGVEERDNYSETTTYYCIGRAMETFESANFTYIQWDTAAVYPWYIDSVEANAHSGKYSARSAKIRGRQLSVLKLPLHTIADDTLSFWVKTSTEGSYDILSFFIDGEKVAQWSGMMQWTRCKFALARGAHMFTWQYEKDDETSSGQDAVWIDDLELPLAQYTKPIVCPDTTVGIYPIVDTNVIRIYPNPAKNYIVIEQADDKNTRVIVYNIQGVMVDTFGIDNIIYKHSVASYQPGLYTLLLMNDNDTMVKKLLIIK